MQSIDDIDFGALTQRAFHLSPHAWEDQVFYFFLVDRFSDGRERMRSVVAWSRLFTDHEWLVAINTDSDAERAWVVVDFDLNPLGQTYTCLYSSDPAQIGQPLTVAAPRPELRAVWLELPRAGSAVYGQS